MNKEFFKKFKKETYDNDQKKPKSDGHNVQLVDAAIKYAIDHQASDLHIEKYGDGKGRVRIRIDSVLKTIAMLDEKDYDGMISRIKILANMDISERRKPQDGSFFRKFEKNSIDIRVASVPTIHGEKVVLRILDSKRFLMDTGQLGLSEKDEKKVRQMSEMTNGLILIVGQTGCGKTTTLYSLLQEKNCDAINIMTIENPIEYNLFGINQIQVNEKVDLTFESGFRAILRQDPNVIMIGEIRDEMTASTVVKASNTGHLVFSTIHTNDAVSTISRLMDMGVPLYLLSAALRGIVSQRLMRKLCVHCKEAYAPNDYERKYLNLKNKTYTLYRPKGCSICDNTGFKGRKGIFEVFEITHQIREAIHDGVSYARLLELGQMNGFVQFEEHIRQEILCGGTSFEEGVNMIHCGVT